jgi:hypothetical protein
MKSIVINAIEKTDRKTMKKYIKHEFKLLLGKIDGIQIVDEDEDSTDYAKVIVYLRDTNDEAILENRRFIKSRMEQYGSSCLYISNKTPSTIRKWTLVLPTETAGRESYSPKALPLTSEVQESFERRFECLERGLSDQNELIEKLQDENNRLMTKLEHHENTIYQLLGGLFNHKEQANSLNTHLAWLYDEDIEDLPKDPSKWTNYPTTRQGDYLEEQLAKQAEQIESLTELLQKTNKAIDNIGAVQCDNSQAVSKKLTMLEDETSAVQKATGELITNQLDDKRRIIGHITKLDAKSNRQEAVIGKLVNGLFGMTQEKTAHDYLNLLYGRVLPDEKYVNTSKWDSPTTRQGDLTERKMSVLEEHLKEIRARLGKPIMELSESD